MTTHTNSIEIPGSGRRTALLSAMAAFAIGGLLGTGVTLAVTDTDGQRAALGTASQAAPSTVDEAAVPSSVSSTMSADAAERWSFADSRERAATCKSSPMSADALERCVGRS